MKRIESADVIRGFSLYGILMANLLIFQFGLSGKDQIEYYELNTINELLFKAVKVIFEGSFMPIFAILFGFSMDKLFESMKNKGIKWKRFKLLCRAIGILVIGFLHATYIWEGDILLAYGLAMLVSIIFIGLPTWFYKVISGIIIGVLMFILVSSFFVGEIDEVSTVSEAETNEYMTELLTVYQNGTYGEVVDARENMEDPFYDEMMSEFKDSKGLFMILGLFMPALGFMFGINLSRSGWFKKDGTKFWNSALYIWLIPVSIIMKSSIYWLNDETLASNLNLVFGLLLAFGLMSLVKLLFQRYENHMILTGMKNIGKLSLTMYILQSIFGTLVMYGYGLGMFGTNTVIYTVCLFTLFYVLQLILATWYMKHFRYGPLEYLLRIVTYLRIRSRKWQNTTSK
ncbi:DUF418 domain-containing protein [Jeotgalicoccus huakuii]|nr:DUF418 domain-containing protein [Jeotgalicoccus huakuii]